MLSSTSNRPAVVAQVPISIREITTPCDVRHRDRLVRADRELPPELGQRGREPAEVRL
jgi:hypothetical protein